MAKQKLKSVSYFKDLGGIATPSGEIVKKGVLFRSCDFSKMSEKDFGKVENKLFACVDLRTDMEIEIKPDVFCDEPFYHHLPLLTNDENPAVTRETRNGILKRRMQQEGGMKEHLASIYRLMVTSEMSRKNLRKIFDILLSNDSDNFVVYHCTQGKDRTGMVSALILLALGVDKEDVIDDYIKYNRHNRFERVFIWIAVSIRFMSFKAARELNLAMAARKKYILAAFEQMDKSYGGIQEFLRNGIGLTEEEITKLRKLYLFKA